MRRLQVLAFGISGLIVGSAGFAAAPVITIAPEAGLKYVIYGFIASVIGGIGNNAGALLGGPIVGLISAFAAYQARRRVRIARSRARSRGDAADTAPGDFRRDLGAAGLMVTSSAVSASVPGIATANWRPDTVQFAIGVVLVCVTMFGADLGGNPLLDPHLPPARHLSVRSRCC